ncbi:hypothetical protein LL946_17595 [Knoellia locipacati]|uniref:hypothetical protein n=1 Tax=Knoellia locipacati TaxID=882824 RepID=UPI0038517B28
MWPRRRPHDEPVSEEESPAARRYRYLLRTAPIEPLKDVHRSGLATLAAEDRQAVLTTIQSELMSGARLTPEHVDEVSRLTVMGERRRAGAVISHLPADVLQHLALAVGDAGARAGLLEGYDDWDGNDPPPPTDEDSDYRSGFDTVRHYDIVQGRAEGGFSI